MQKKKRKVIRIARLVWKIGKIHERGEDVYNTVDDICLKTKTKQTKQNKKKEISPSER